MRVRDLMTPQPQTIRSDKTLRVVQSMLEWGQFRHVPVVDEVGRLVGVVSLTDVLRASASEFDVDAPRAERELRLARVSVRQAMNEPAVAVDPETLVGDAARCMQHYRINCLPVVENERVVGIVTAFDLLGAVSRQTTPAR